MVNGHAKRSGIRSCHFGFSYLSKITVEVFEYNAKVPKETETNSRIIMKGTDIWPHLTSNVFSPFWDVETKYCFSQA